MCTVNQKPVEDKSEVIGYKICRFGKTYTVVNGRNVFNGLSVFSLYKDHIWKKGKNIAYDFASHYDKYSLFSSSSNSTQINENEGFHCFKSYKDALNFARNYIYEDQVRYTLLIIKVKLVAKPIITNLETDTIREGNNEISSPVEDYSPCYVAPIAIWDGTYKKLNKGILT